MASERPTVLPEWASLDVLDPTSGQYNVVEPPTEVKENGWALGEKPNRQWWNWFQRHCYLWLQWLNEQPISVTTNASGVALFTVNDAIITIDAIDRADTSKYLRAIGYKALGSAPVFPAASIQSNGLTLGVGTIAGNQPITGGANTIIRGTSSIIY
jgi:hypothetical protein